MIFFAFLFASLMQALQPWVTTILALYVLRVLMCVCLSVPTASPLVPDYIKKESRGKASAIVSSIVVENVDWTHGRHGCVKWDVPNIWNDA